MKPTNKLRQLKREKLKYVPSIPVGHHTTESELVLQQWWEGDQFLNKDVGFVTVGEWRDIEIVDEKV